MCGMKLAAMEARRGQRAEPAGAITGEHTVPEHKSACYNPLS
jgi:hypothetical protein